MDAGEVGWLLDDWTGKIAEIIGAKSTRRREIFEEAAGISNTATAKQKRSESWRRHRKTCCA